MPEICDFENNIKRLRLYTDLAEENPLYYRAVCKAEEEIELSLDTRLYLYGFVPAILKFAEWVLEEAARSGKKRLYFLSRDGYQIYLAAYKLAELRKLPVECRYLYMSRYAIRIPSYYLDMKNSLDRICAGGMKVTPERILKRGALTDEEACEVAERIGRKDIYTNILNRRQIMELKGILESEPLFLQYVKAHSMEAYENAMGYLQQEGLLSDVPYAIVDSGWVGTCQQSLQLLIQSRMPGARIEGYYFGLYEIPPDADFRDYHGWNFTPRKGLKQKISFSNSLFEAVCSADEGMTVGYFRKDGRYLPRLDSEGNPNGEKLRRNLEALRCFLEKYDEASAAMEVEKIESYGRTGDGRKSVNNIFTLVMARPSTVELEHFGDFLFSDDMLAGSCQTVAVQLTRKEIRNLYMLRRLCILVGLRKGVIRESAWIEGSIVRCGMYGDPEKACGAARTAGPEETDEPESSDGAERIIESKKTISQGRIDRLKRIAVRGMKRLYIRRSLRHIRWYKLLVYGRKQLKAWMRK